MSNNRGMPTAHLWRRLVAELGTNETVRHLDVFTDGSRDVCVAVCDDRVLMWHPLSDRMRRLTRGTLTVAEHTATATGVLRLSDGSSKTPARLAGDLAQRRALLAALSLPGGRRAAAPVALNLSTHPRTKFAYKSSADKPAPTGPVAEHVLRALGTSKASLLTAAYVAFPGWSPIPVVVLGTGGALRFVPNGGPDPLFTEIRRDGLGCAPAPGGVRLLYTQPVRTELATVLGSPAVLDAVTSQVQQWVALVEQQRQRTAEPADGSGPAPVAVPIVRRSTFLRRPQPMPVRSWQEAEAVACAWMREFRFTDARATGPGADAGVDVESRRAVAQVKWTLSSAVGRPAVQQLYGVAQGSKRKPVFFSGSGYTAAARDWAEAHNVAAFTLTALGEVVPITTAARKLVRR